MKILFIGDVVGEPGREAVKKLLPALREEYSADLVVANGENAAAGAGLTPRIADELFKSGCDVLTSGDHIWDRGEIREYIEKSSILLRPANFPDGAPGKGFCVVESSSGEKVGIINLLGRVFMRYNVNCPFREVKKIIENIKREARVILVDMHAEATSEKIALSWFIDGQVSAMVGTHTHVATADEAILPGGTAYITDLGMTGPHDSVIGQNKDRIVEHFLTSMPSKFEVATKDVRLNGVVIDIDEATGKAKAITRVQRKLA